MLALNTMDLISQLQHASSTEQFNEIIKSNIAIIHDLLQAPKVDLLRLKPLVDDLILFKKRIILSLDYSSSENRVFLQMLLYLTIKLGLKSSLNTLVQIIKRTTINLPLRLNVALLYLGSYQLVAELVNNFDQIIHLIEQHKDEEDDSKELTAMLVQYFSYMLYNYAGSNSSEVTRLQQKFNDAQSSGQYFFLNGPIIDEVIQCNISDYNQQYTDIIEQLDLYLEHKKIVFNINDYLVEEEGSYHDLFVINPSYSNLIDIAKSSNPGVYNELGRGVSILDSQDQMLQYLYSFGHMHEAKLVSAFESIDFSRFDGEQLELIDWGCGQGIASLLFHEFAYKKNCHPTIESVTLVEPSELCIRRAALHIREILRPNKIYTLNSTLDELSYSRIKTTNSNIKIHLFSNILDVESFSLALLTQGIKSNYGGLNYFVCVSPYINDFKTNRLDVFMQGMENQSFVLYKNKNVSEGYWNCSNNYKKNRCIDHSKNGCGRKWRKAVRVFSTDL